MSPLPACGQLSELRHVDLRFMSDKVTAFLNAVTELNLTSAELPEPA